MLNVFLELVIYMPAKSYLPRESPQKNPHEKLILCNGASYYQPSVISCKKVLSRGAQPSGIFTTLMGVKATIS